MSKQTEFAVILKMNPMFADLGADDRRQRIDHDGARIEPLYVGFGSGSSRHVFSMLHGKDRRFAAILSGVISPIRRVK